MTRSPFLVVTLCVAVMIVGCGDDRDPPAGPRPSATVSASAGPMSPPASVSLSPSPSPSKPPATSGTPLPSDTRPVTPTPKPPAGLPAHLLGKDWERLPTTEKVVALTFDGGGSAAGVASILDTLRRENIHATFFLTGKFARAFPEPVRSTASAGHMLGNHSDDHPYFTRLSEEQVRGQMSNAERSIEAAAGRSPRPLFRFPYGDRDATAIQRVNGLGYVPVRWTVDTLGWRGTSGGQSTTTVTSRVLDGATPGGIVLMHLGANPDDGSTLDADALPGMITGLRERGYRFVTLDALAG